MDAFNHDDSENSHFDIAIVGAGIVGVSAAIAFSELGYRVALIDRQAKPSSDMPVERCSVSDFSPRVSALTPANVEFFKQLNVWRDTLVSHALPYQFMEVWEELGGGRIKFDAAEYQATALGYIVENPVLLASCMTVLERKKQVVGFFGQAIQSFALQGSDDASAMRYAITFSNDSVITADLLIGADGANSSVRRMLNLPTREWDYEQEAIVCTVELEKPHGLCARQRFSESGPVAFLPLKDTLGSADGHFCSIVWSIDSNKVNGLFELSDEAFTEELKRQIEAELGDIKAVSKRYKFPLRQRHAKSYVADQAILMGDAAHNIHPLAGQGLNLGLEDAQAMQEIASDAKDKGYALSNPILLRRYERARKSDNLSMMLGMEGFKRLFGATDPMLRLLRNIGVDTVNRHTLIKRQIAKKAMGL